MTMVEWLVEADFHQGDKADAPTRKGVLSSDEVRRFSEMLEG